MKIAIMQPYLLPYIGYYQLVNTVDVFVFYDDVNFITKGYIHRNAILGQGAPLPFTVPLSKASQNTLIKDVQVHQGEYAKWWYKFKKTLKQNYTSAPFYDEAMNLLDGIFEKSSDSISELAEESVRSVSAYLGLDTMFKKSSELSYDRKADTEKKIMELCANLGADTYINPIGGKELYTAASFVKNNMELLFLKSKQITYPQKKEDFVPSLSIIDVLMYNDKTEILKYIEQFELIKTA